LHTADIQGGPQHILIINQRWAKKADTELFDNQTMVNRLNYDVALKKQSHYSKYMVNTLY